MRGVDGPRRRPSSFVDRAHSSPAAVRALAVLAAASLLLAPPLTAQGAPSAFGPDPLATLGAVAPTAGSWTYRSTVERDGATLELGRRTLTVRS